MNRIILNYNSTNSSITLNKLYHQALCTAEELFLATAYLTAWDFDGELDQKCKNVIILFGVDFGLTRKEACMRLLRWLPAKHKHSLYAVDRSDYNFHPKILLWTSNQKHYCIVGSSNLSLAGFADNFEANFIAEIDERNYEEARSWLLNIRDELCSPVDEGWINHYKEGNFKGKKSVSTQPTSPKIVRLPNFKETKKFNIAYRRHQQEVFLGAKTAIIKTIRECASNNISNEIFYERMNTLWASQECLLQSKTYSIKCMHSNWMEVCKSLVRILDHSTKVPSKKEELDTLVREEIDRLTELRHPARSAWLSEMLCHFFPGQFPLINKPVEWWLAKNKYRAPKGASQGARYIDRARKLRLALADYKMDNRNPKIQDLLELDVAIWLAYEVELKKKTKNEPHE